jgi:hypothetical protein
MPAKTALPPAKTPGNTTLSIWSTPAKRELVKRLRERTGMSFSTIVWTLVEAYDRGRITIDFGVKVENAKVTRPALKRAPT